MSENNSLIKCLGKSLKTEIKFIAICKFRFYDELGKEIRYKSIDQGQKQIICLGRDRMFLIKGDMSKIIERLRYDSFNCIELETRNMDSFSLWVDTSLLDDADSKLRRVVITAKFRGILVKNILCYYSVYYMTNYHEIRDLKMLLCKESDNKKEEAKKGLSRIYKQVSTKNYE